MGIRSSASSTLERDRERDKGRNMVYIHTIIALYVMRMSDSTTPGWPDVQHWEVLVAVSDVCQV